MSQTVPATTARATRRPTLGLIAQILGISVGGSKSQLNRAKNKVKEILTSRSYV